MTRTLEERNAELSEALFQCSKELMESDDENRLLKSANESLCRANAAAQDVNASLLAACKLAEIQLRFVSFPSHKEEEAINAVLTAITNAEAAQTPKTHEGHNASRAVREASE